MFKFNSFEKKVNLITVVICLTIIFSVFREYQSGMIQRGHEILNQFNTIHANIKNESQLVTKFVGTSRRFAENYFLFSRGKSSNWFKNLKYNKQHKVTHLADVPIEYREQKLGNLTSISTSFKSDPEKIIEMNMALELGTHFAPGLFEVTNSPWFYYTSDDFMYLAPYLEPKDFVFSKKLLIEKEFYKNAKPENNPNRKGFWTSVYMDEAGLGLMVTYSEPVYDGPRFKGAVSMDVTVDQFNSVIRRQDITLGKWVLFNHVDQVLAEPSSVGSSDRKISKASEILPPELLKLAKDAKNSYQSNLVYVDSKLAHFEEFKELNAIMVFYVQAWELKWLTIKKMFPLIVFSLLCMLLIFWLRHAFLNDYLIQQSFIQNAKMSALGRMAAGMAHEINNPLAIIVGKANALKRIVDTTQTIDLKMLSQDLGKILSTTNRIAKIISSLRSFSRNGDGDPFFETPLNKWLNETLELCRETMASNSISLTVGDIPDVKFMARESQLSQVLINLLNNSVDAVKHGEVKEISISFEVTKSKLKLFVRDSGQIISSEVQSRLMEPFFTTKAPGAGTGLGLSISLGIMKEHKGNMSFIPEDSRTCFMMELPIC